MNTRRLSVPAAAFMVGVPAVFLIILTIPVSREAFVSLTASHPYIMGFVKFALLATAGEILAGAVSNGRAVFPKGAAAKAAVWGLIGMMMAVLMPIYSSGVAAAQNAGLLPFSGSAVAAAISTSIAMNLTFGIAMMGFHRVTDKLIEMRCDGRKAGVALAAAEIDWQRFVTFVVLRTIPLFWIPAHSITFSLPPIFRVIVSAGLSMVLGLILALSNKKTAPAAK